MACAATENAGPSPAPRITRQISSVVNPIVPTIGNCASAQTPASTIRTQRVATRLTMKPTTIAEIENRKKNEEPSSPNCAVSSFSSVMIGTPARPTTILSAKFTSMNKNRRNVILQAPFGVGCVVMVASPSFVCWRCGSRSDASHGLAGIATGLFGSTAGRGLPRRCDHRRLSLSSSDLLCTAERELAERVDHGDNRLAKVFVVHAGGAPGNASASHVAAVSCRTTTVGWHGYPLDFQVTGVRLSLDDFERAGFLSSILKNLRSLHGDETARHHSVKHRQEALD